MHASPRGQLAWVVTAVLLAVAGMTGAMFAASSVARNDSGKARQAFERSSADVASTLQLALQHEEDLVQSVGAFIVSNPEATNAEFHEWGAALHWAERYPEVAGFGHMVIVPAADLPAFAEHAQASPVRPLDPSGIFTVLPPGNRPYYCLSALSQERGVGPDVPVGLDFCDGRPANAKLTARDTGHGSYTPFDGGQNMWLDVVTPLYRHGIVPTTLVARRTAFMGWVGMAVVPSMILDRALEGHADTAVTIRYRKGASTADFSSGRAAADAQSVTIDLHNGWAVQTFGTVTSRSVWGNGNALALLIAGAVLSLLLGALVFVLSTGRERALRLVQVRTSELRVAQVQLVDAARQAGRAEIAVNVLHNVGNVLNSVHVSATLVTQKVRHSTSAGLSSAVALLDEHADDLGDFFTADARGKAFPGDLGRLATALEAERASIDEDLVTLAKGVTHITEIVSAQQSLAGVSGVIEPLKVNKLMEHALRMSGIMGDPAVSIIRDLPDAPLLSMDRHRILLVLLNLLSNASRAMAAGPGRSKHLNLDAVVTGGSAVFTVRDNGEGIPAENLTRIFVHGFTTHDGALGFGLHSSALAAQEMGGTLTARSDGPGTGATFTLAVPLTSRSVAG